MRLALEQIDQRLSVKFQPKLFRVAWVELLLDRAVCVEDVQHPLQSGSRGNIDLLTGEQRTEQIGFCRRIENEHQVQLDSGDTFNLGDARLGKHVD